MSEGIQVLDAIPEGKKQKGSKHPFMNSGKTVIKKPPVRMTSYELLKLGSSKSISSPIATSPRQRNEILSPKKILEQKMDRVMSITENGLLKTLMNKADTNRNQQIKATLERLMSGESKHRRSKNN